MKYFLPSSYLLILLIFPHVYGKVDETRKRYVKVGSLQSHFSAYGSERAWNNTYYEGLVWPADYLYQDNAVIKRSWIACKNLIDETNHNWDHFGIYLTLADVGNSIYPTKLYQIAKFMPPTVYVDGDDINSFYNAEIDSINPSIKSDRIIINEINTSMGLTMERKIYAFQEA